MCEVNTVVKVDTNEDDIEAKTVEKKRTRETEIKENGRNFIYM